MATTIKYSELNAWLASQVENTASTPYEIIITEVTDDDLVGGNGTSSNPYKGIQKVLMDNSTKYVSIKDLQGTVTSIGARAFNGCESLISIEIPNGVTYIGDYAFQYCSNLTSIEIPDSVTYISNTVSRYGDSSASFGLLSNVTTVIVSPNNTTYDSRNNCNAIIETATNKLIFGCKNTVIPGGVTSIGIYAFYYCTSLTSIEIPNGVTSIDRGAFYECSSLTSIVISDSVTSIDRDAFYNCSSLTSIVIPNGVPSIGRYAFYECTSLASIEIPDSVTSIGDYAFTYCSSLTSIKIPDSVTSIGRYAFYECTSLASIEIPDSVTSIGDSAFEGCNNLKTLYIGKAIEIVMAPTSIETVIWVSNPTSIGEKAFQRCTSLTSITIPESVTSIGNSAFSYCESLTSIEIPDSVTYIGNSAFSGCSNLTSIEIPDSVTSIGESAFHGCSRLTSIVIPDSVTSIGSAAFRNCSSLTSITIPESVTSIDYRAFSSCSSLINVEIYGNPTISSASFSGVSANFIVNPEVWTQGYSTDFGGATISIFYDFDGNPLTPITPATLSICLEVLPENTVDTPYEITITEVTNTDLEGDDVTPKNIQKAIKDNITKFVSIKVEGEVTAIGDSAFADCNNLVAFEIPNTVTILGKGAFYNTGITEITVPGSVTEMDCYYLFAECTYLRKITFNNGEISPTNVGSMFQECINLKEVNLLWLNTENVTDYSDMFVNDTIDVYVNHYIWTLGTDDPQFSNATEITWHDVRLEMEITDDIEDSEVYYGVVKVLRVNAIANFGSAVITYQWYKNDILMDTVTGNSFTYVALEDGTYKCVVTATLGDDSVTKTTEGTITVVPYYDEGTKIIVHGSQTVRGDIYIHGEIQGDFMKSILDRIEALEQRN